MIPAETSNPYDEDYETHLKTLLADRRTGLEEYYDVLIVCNSCGQSYGSDEKTDNGICPDCSPRSRRIKRKYKKNKANKSGNFFLPDLPKRLIPHG